MRIMMVQAVIFCDLQRGISRKSEKGVPCGKPRAVGSSGSYGRTLSHHTTTGHRLALGSNGAKDFGIVSHKHRFWICKPLKAVADDILSGVGPPPPTAW
jgi:hypothetical protein